MLSKIRTGNLLFLAEGRKPHPMFLKRCVYAIAKDDPTPEGLSKAFAICIANAQEYKRIEKGSGTTLTKAGQSWSRHKARKQSGHGFTLDAYEKLLSTVRKARRKQKKEESKSTLIDTYRSLHEELIGEVKKDMPKFRKTVVGISGEVSGLRDVAKARSTAALPTMMQQLILYILGGSGNPGILSTLGLAGMETAVGLPRGPSVVKPLEALKDAILDDPDIQFDWELADRKIKTMMSLTKELKGTAKPEEVVSILADLFIDLSNLLKPLIKSDNPGVQTAATTVSSELKKATKGLMTLGWSA
jgi:hypothetical protein